jgi:carbon-monoxide dehydrogenase large subunit
MPEKLPIPQFLGVRVKRREDPDLITGQGKYVADLQLEDTLHMKVVRSPYAHARITRIETDEAEAMAGVVAVLIGADLMPHLHRPLPMGRAQGSAFTEARNPERYPLATDKVRCVGEAVAVVVAETPYLAADTVDMVHVDYDPLPVVVEPEQALTAGAPILHEDWPNNVAYRWSKSSGDVDAAFSAAEVQVELRLVNQRVISNAIEPRAVLAQYDADTEAFTVWTTTQTPFSVRDNLAATLDVPVEKVRVIAPVVGGGFGAKVNKYGEEVMAPFLSRQLGRPVKWVATRAEDYLATHHGRGQIDTIRLAADRDGRVSAADLQIILDCGAYYTVLTPAIPGITTAMMSGAYAIPNIRSQGIGVFTNKHSADPYRGAGRPEAAYLIERAMDVLAQRLDMDPAELRRRNFIPPESFPYKSPTGATYDSGEYARAMDKALALADYPSLRAEQARRRKKGGKLMGIGLACYVENCGGGPWEAGGVSMDAEGKVIVLSGTSPQGQGHETTWAQIAASELQIPMEDITVKHSDTAVVSRGIGTFGSRSTSVGGSAVQQNAQTVREQATRVAAHLIEAAAEDMVLSGGRFHVVGAPESSLSWQEVAQATYHQTLSDPLPDSLSADEDFVTEDTTYPFGTHICVVEIDPENGEIEIIRYLTVDDCGRVINPMIVEGQVHGGITQGVGQALFERAVYDELGNLLTGTLMDSAIARADMMPLYETNQTETPSPVNPLGVKGIGEAATIGATPTVVNAVVDALSHLGIEHLDMPLFAERVWQVLPK